MNLPPKHILSKSTFLYGWQCSLRLWLHKFQPGLKDPIDEGQQQIFDAGTRLGMLARDLFPGGHDASPPEPYQYALSVKKTAELIAAGVSVIYEAAFQFEGLLCAVDILVKKNGQWYAYEVKSSTQVKDIYKLDAAFQYNVISSAGLPLTAFSLVYVNNQYVRKGALQLNELFATEDLTKELQSRQAAIGEKSVALKYMLTEKIAPEGIVPGPQCTRPYRCDFYSHCHAGEAAPSQVVRESSIQRDAINSFLAAVQYPVYYFDFEAWNSPIPLQDGHWPFRAVCFQYDVYIQREPGSELEHHHYLAGDIYESSHLLLDHLLKVIGEKGSIVVYNAVFERTRLLEYIREYPEKEAAIQSVIQRLVDLLEVFTKGYYYHTAMGSSLTLKSVLAAISPEDNHAQLTINNGMNAGAAFFRLQSETNPEKIAAVRKALEEYCAMDTLAMHRILEHLRMLVAQ
ncbi:MAG: DUF2779 domain-containing protein [Bacteroidota bacterium]